jgi:hypothetical protein
MPSASTRLTLHHSSIVESWQQKSAESFFFRTGGAGGFAGVMPLGFEPYWGVASVGPLRLEPCWEDSEGPGLCQELKAMDAPE